MSLAKRKLVIGSVAINKPIQYSYQTASMILVRVSHNDVIECK
jgi:hypothetical protein